MVFSFTFQGSFLVFCRHGGKHHSLCSYSMKYNHVYIPRWTKHVISRNNAVNRFPTSKRFMFYGHSCFLPLLHFLPFIFFRIHAGNIINILPRFIKNLQTVTSRYMDTKKSKSSNTTAHNALPWNLFYFREGL